MGVRWIGVGHDRCSAAIVAAWERAGVRVHVDAGPVTCADPLSWALLQRRASVTVTVFGIDPPGDPVTVPIPAGMSYDELAAAVAEAAAPALRRAGSGAGTSTPDPTPPELPLDPEWARIEWGDAAVRIAAQVSAFRPHGGATTRLGDVPLRVQRARALPEPTGLPPGTVVVHDVDGLVVAAGDGAVRVEGLLDALGALDPTSVPLGGRLGGPTAGEIDRLQRRVADLETQVRYLNELVAKENAGDGRRLPGARTHRRPERWRDAHR